MSDEGYKLRVLANGPIRVESAPTEIEMPDGTKIMKEGKFTLCRCGASENKPFCDGAHGKAGFKG